MTDYRPDELHAFLAKAREQVESICRHSKKRPLETQLVYANQILERLENIESLFAAEQSGEDILSEVAAVIEIAERWGKRAQQSEEWFEEGSK